MKYDAFISYRRKGGSEKAELLKAILAQRGYKEKRIFMDTHTLRSSNYKEKIKEAIAQSVNFIVIITKGCFDNNNGEDLWIDEISEAMRLKKNIIPVFFDNIESFADINLPQSLHDLSSYNAVIYNPNYANAFYSRLCSFLIKDPDSKKTKILVSCLSLIIALAAVIIYLFYPRHNDIEGVVDLGLPSGTLWAKCNLGATDPSEYGDYYAWGDTTSSLSQSSQLYDSLFEIIGTNYDVAFKQLGKNWQLPTRTQFEELINNCKWEWTTQQEHEGFLVIGKNGKNIFLPAAGCIIRDSIMYRERHGYYWTGESKRITPKYGEELLIGKNSINTESGNKNIPRSVRPVYIK